jgi:hypothetical protein
VLASTLIPSGAPGAARIRRSKRIAPGRTGALDPDNLLTGFSRSRSPVSFSEAAEEASVSRIYNGNHTRIDQVAGEDLGRDAADFVLHHDLLPSASFGR